MYDNENYIYNTYSFAPFSFSKLTISGCSVIVAHINAVFPKLSLIFKSAPFFISNFVISGCSVIAIIVYINTVFPLLF